MRYYQIGEAAELTGLSRDTLRFYEKKGILHSLRKENGYRLYTESDIAALISIRYRRHMNHSLEDIENDLIGDHFSIENMKRLTEEAMIREEEELRRHRMSLKRLSLTMRDIEDIESFQGKYVTRSFPVIFRGPSYPSYMEAIRAWFQLCSEKDGLDMCYMMDRYELRSEPSKEITPRGPEDAIKPGLDISFLDTTLIYHSGVDGEIEEWLKAEGWSGFGLSGADCAYTVAEDPSEAMPKEALRELYLSADGLHQVRPVYAYAINLVDSYKNEDHTRFRGLYLPLNAKG